MCLTWKYKKIYIKNYFLRTKPWIKDFEKKIRPNKLIEKATNNLESTQTAKYFFNNKKKKTTIGTTTNMKNCDSRKKKQIPNKRNMRKSMNTEEANDKTTTVQVKIKMKILCKIIMVIM